MIFRINMLCKIVQILLKRVKNCDFLTFFTILTSSHSEYSSNFMLNRLFLFLWSTQPRYLFCIRLEVCGHQTEILVVFLSWIKIHLKIIWITYICEWVKRIFSHRRKRRWSEMVFIKMNLFTCGEVNSLHYVTNIDKMNKFFLMHVFKKLNQ